MSPLKLAALLVTSVIASCGIVDSVSDYAGPPENDDGGLEAEAGKACSSALDCDDDNPCTSDECSSGHCNQSARDGESCSDDNACNGDEVCDSAGNCVRGIPPKIEDDDWCTVDTCDATKGVQHTPGNYPPLQSCTFQFTCPENYFVSQIICSGDCPPSQYGVNGVICERVCKPELVVCCNDCTATTCPAGYQPSGFMSTTCICGTPASGLICKR